jgi:hypothetical protein
MGSALRTSPHIFWIYRLTGSAFNVGCGRHRSPSLLVGW